ncbi:SDR family NAD(P)-dependent oxidoreductase [Streptomyces sp. NPDC041068]|uniref:SDR family NAD(P)-dependent oxidoreductase n=1 Tax=Streptomyces sp. NPDC041068 TaxID=3155130 RepID=UPI0033F7DA9F
MTTKTATTTTTTTTTATTTTKKTYVITGGTDGLGKAVARTYLERGQEVAVVGRNAEKGEAWLTHARRHGAADRAHFVRADLSLLSETRAVMDTLSATLTKIDALVLCARHFRSTRLVTAEGFENTLAHFYLSRFVLSHGLTDLLEAADTPVVLNVAGPGGGGRIFWEDLQLARHYDGGLALGQGGRLNDLLGVGYAAGRPGSKVRYVLHNPGTVSTSFSGEYAPDVLAHVEAMRRSAPPVSEAVLPLLHVLDAPPAPGLSAYALDTPLDVTGPDFALPEARRLHALTNALLTGG